MESSLQVTAPESFSSPPPACPEAKLPGLSQLTWALILATRKLFRLSSIDFSRRHSCAWPCRKQKQEPGGPDWPGLERGVALRAAEGLFLPIRRKQIGSVRLQNEHPEMLHCRDWCRKGPQGITPSRREPTEPQSSATQSWPLWLLKAPTTLQDGLPSASPAGKRSRGPLRPTKLEARKGSA